MLQRHNFRAKIEIWGLEIGILLLVLPFIAQSASAASGASVFGEPPTADPIAPPPPAASNDDFLLLEVEINDQPTGKIGEFVLRRGILLARPEELWELGFRVPAAAYREGGGLIPLSSLAGLTWRIDQTEQKVFVAIPDSGLQATQLAPIGTKDSRNPRTVESGTGATLNYDVMNTFSENRAGSTGSFDMRAFSRWGVASSRWLTYAGASTGTNRATRAVRLDSAYTFADVNSLRRYSVGDFVTSGLTWTRPVHMEGIQIRSDFSTRPDLVTFPMPMIAGSTAVPSTVSVMADGNQVVSGEVGAGPFEIPELPVISGAGMVSMTVTNAMGQQVTISQPFYASSSLLIPALSTFSVQVGLVRRSWGLSSYDYGKAAATAVYRRGLTRKFTFEGSAEATPGVFAAGGGGVLQIGNFGIANFAATGSGGAAHNGAQLSAGFQRIGRVFSAGGSATIASRGYRDIASMNGDGTVRKQYSAFSSLSLRRFGSLGAGYGSIDQDAAPVFINGATRQRSQVVSVSYSVQFHRVSVYASLFNNVASANGSSGFQAGLIIPFGKRNSMDVGGSSNGNATFEVQQPAPQIGDRGYQAYVTAGNTKHAFVEAQMKTRAGLFSIGADTNDGKATFRLESQGALSIADRSIFVSNEIYDSFAIVDTGPIHHVRVLQENREVGRTDSSGRLLVPDMRSFDLNHITIEPTDIPPDVTINDPSYSMRPQDRSGVVVRFPIKFSHSALVHLVGETGTPLPLGTVATLVATGVSAPVGYDGATYLENLSAHNELTVERADGAHCRANFEYHPAPGEIPSIGPIRCLETRQ